MDGGIVESGVARWMGSWGGTGWRPAWVPEGRCRCRPPAASAAVVDCGVGRVVLVPGASPGAFPRGLGRSRVSDGRHTGHSHGFVSPRIGLRMHMVMLVVEYDCSESVIVGSCVRSVVVGFDLLDRSY